MMEPELELALTTGDDGKPEVLDAKGTSLFGTTPLKAAGRILTLTAGEAMRCGMAVSIAADVDSMREGLHLPAWHKASDDAWYAMTDAARHAKIAREQQNADRQPSAKAGAGTETSAVAKAKAQLAAVEARASAAQKKLETLKADYQKELDGAHEEYKQAIASANTMPSPALAAAAASHKKAARLKKANETFPAQLDAAQKGFDQAVSEYNDLVNRLNKSLASGGE
jgi:chromosome segregation ATPase